MHPYPHTYAVSASGGEGGSVSVSSRALLRLETTPPPEFDGPEGFWSPETLLCGAVADCFILTFRSVSRAAHLRWVRLECHVEGMLERRDGVAQFTRFTTIAALTVPDDVDAAKARALLERAEQLCLVSNSLRGERTLQIQVTTVARTAAPAEFTL
jgi:organic hydroperoxide reductase OsmC/OhrA